MLDKIRRPVAVAAAFCVASGVLAAGLGADEDTEQRFSVSGVPDIVVRNSTNGDTTVRGYDGSEVRVRTIIEGRERDVEVRVRQNGNRIAAEASRHRRWFSWGRGPRVHFEIDAPRLSDVDARGDDGDLSVRGFDGRLVLTVDDGELEASDITGELTVTSDDGPVELRQVGGTVAVTVEDGRVHVSGVDGWLSVVGDDGNLDLQAVNGAVDVRTEDGDLRLTGVLTSLRVVTDDGRLDIRAEAGSRMEEEWSVRSEDGAVSLALPDGFTANLTVQTDDGAMRVDPPLTVQGSVSRHRLSGQLNGGGPALRVSSEDGRITITR